MRLIDADKLIEDYKKELEKVDFENLSDDDKLIIATSAKALVDFTKRQPIAYDIDKVVETLERLHKECDGRTYAYQRAIEIVKEQLKEI